MVDELLRRFAAALDLEGEDGDAALREVMLVERMIRMRGERGMVDLLDLRMFREIVDDLQGVLHMALDAQGKRLNALQQEERIKRRDRRARVAQKERTQIDGESGSADVLREGKAMVARVRLDEPREAPRCRPVELAAVDDDAAERRAVSADELRRRVNDDVRAVLDGTQLIRRRKRRIDDERNAVLVRDGGDRLDVDEVRVRIADGLDVDDLRVFPNCRLEGRRAARRIDKRRLDTEVREGMLKKIVGAAIDRRLSDDVLSRMNESLQRCRHGRCARGKGERRDAAFKRRHAFFEHVLRRIHEPAIDVARILQTETIRRMLRIAEHV